MKLALLVGRDMASDRSWGIVLRELVSGGHMVVGLARPLSEDLSALLGSSPVEIFPRDIVTEEYLTLPSSDMAAGKLAEYFRDPRYPETHAVLLGMMSRRDSSGTFRTLERDVVVRRLQLALLSQLLRANPTHVVFEETPHEAADFALFRLAEWLNIPVLFFQPSLVGPQVVARTSLGDLLPVEYSLIGPTNCEDDRARVRDIALNAIGKLQAGGGTALLDRQKRIDTASTARFQSLRVIRYLTRQLFTRPSNRQVNFTGHRYLSEGLRRILGMLFEWSLRKSLVRRVAALPAQSRSAGGPYALFALHYEPERTNMPEGLPFLSQLDAILEARRFLPQDVTLLVKEHYAQQSSSLRGYVGRSPLAYDYLESIPGIEVLGVAADSRALMQRAECIFTMTGKIGIEAAFAGTRAVYFGQPWWRGMPGSFAFDSLSSWTHLKQSSMPQEADVEEWFEQQVSSRLLVGLGGTSPEKYSSRIAPLPESFDTLEAESILAAIRTFAARA